MIENKYPIFGHGQTISKKALDLLRDNPAELTNLMYLDHKDGIITGFDLITDSENKRVIVTKGIVKCGGKIFWMNDNYNFDMPEIENRYILKLKLYSDFEERKFYIRNADFSLEILNNDNINIEQEETVITNKNTKYSSKHELGTLHPKILELFGKDASKKENLDIFDINFYVNCLNGNVERDVIIAYINLKLHLEQENYSNEELYQYLVKILENLGKDREIVEKKRIIPRKITIE